MELLCRKNGSRSKGQSRINFRENLSLARRVRADRRREYPLVRYLLAGILKGYTPRIGRQPFLGDFHVSV